MIKMTITAASLKEIEDQESLIQACSGKNELLKILDTMFVEVKNLATMATPVDEERLELIKQRLRLASECNELFKSKKCSLLIIKLDILLQQKIKGNLFSSSNI